MAKHYDKQFKEDALQILKKAMGILAKDEH
ncbi:hypothetical protein AB984_01354 [Erysipelothrix rhusiopathiae]|nr:hypothetical protein AB984_01354 [Erysipelothrix rhusiopathiae]QDE04794.1 hypothetical protein AB985_01368 [Erysipelothrix rhusiopathiae]STD06299.1 Uncharacterised protein [Erysipelothrix rhusiopathiae]